MKFRQGLMSIIVVSLLAMPAGFALAQEVMPEAAEGARDATGGAQTLEDILRRQQGLAVDDRALSAAGDDPDAAPSTTSPLGTLGGASDADLWRALRYDTADVTTTAQGPATGVLVQDGGMAWLLFREGPLLKWGGYAILGMLALLAVFFLLRGRIRTEAALSGRLIERFKSVERFAHWLMAGSFILLGVTGLITLFGRLALIPLFGHEPYAVIAGASKWVHNNVSWAFMLGLAMVFLLWVVQNIPNRHDLVWLAKGGGLFAKGVHPPAKKFNAGQKIIFWLVIILGVSISASGLSLLFPFELPMFAATFEKLNSLGLTALVGLDPLPTVLQPQQEMQYAQIWHSVVAFAFIVIILAHIYLGSVGMEGAFDAMGTGEVDEQWAKEHHNLWYEEVTGKTAPHGDAKATPAE